MNDTRLPNVETTARTILAQWGSIPCAVEYLVQKGDHPGFVLVLARCRLKGGGIAIVDRDLRVRMPETKDGFFAPFQSESSVRQLCKSIHQDLIAQAINLGGQLVEAL